MIRLQAVNTTWSKNFHAHISQVNKRRDMWGWNTTRRQVLAEYGGKLSKAGGKVTFVFAEEKHATLFLLRFQ